MNPGNLGAKQNAQYIAAGLTGTTDAEHPEGRRSAAKLEQRSEESSADVQIAIANHIDQDLQQSGHEKNRKSDTQNGDSTHSATGQRQQHHESKYDESFGMEAHRPNLSASVAPAIVTNFPCHVALLLADALLDEIFPANSRPARASPLL
jgi:hypothetical protein